MEGAIAGVKDSNTKQDTTSAQNIGEQQILSAVDGALVAVQSTQQKAPRNRVMSLLLTLFNELHTNAHQELSPNPDNQASKSAMLVKSSNASPRFSSCSKGRDSIRNRTSCGNSPTRRFN